MKKSKTATTPEKDTWVKEMVAKTSEFFNKFKTGSPEKQRRYLKFIDELILSEEVRGEPMEDSAAEFLKDLKGLLELEVKK